MFYLSYVFDDSVQKYSHNLENNEQILQNLSTENSKFLSHSVKFEVICHVHDN